MTPDHDDLKDLTAGALAGMDLTYMEPKAAAKAAVDVAREAAHRLVTVESLQQSATLAPASGAVVISLLVSWYAFGWIAVLLWCRKFEKMTLTQLIAAILGGPFAAIGWAEWPNLNPVIWRRKP